MNIWPDFQLTNTNVQDILELPGLEQAYDLVLDNYCLQSIVTDQDRQKLFSNVRSGLKETGYYVLSTAMYNDTRIYGGDSFYEAETGIVYVQVDRGDLYTATTLMDDCYWVPYRRHLTEDKLRRELEDAGFRVVFQEEGNVICQIK